MLDRMQKKDGSEEEKKIIKKQSKLQIEFQNNHIESIMVNQRIVDTLSSKEKDSSFLKKIYDKITISEKFFSRDLYVPNVFRYVLKKEDGKFSLYSFKEKHKSLAKSGFNDMPITKREDIPSIALILESPHKDEYNDDFVPIAPAQGTTGDLIFEKLDVLLNESRFLDLFKEDMYQVIIVNPIPVQTSLHHLHKEPLSGVYKTLRDKVWICLWKKGNYKEYFLEVLEDTKPKIILNCCTAELTKYISDEIPKNKKVLEIHHPSSWWRDNEYIKIEERA